MHALQRQLEQQLDELEARIQGNKRLARTQRADLSAQVRKLLRSPWVIVGACVVGVFAGRALFRRRIYPRTPETTEKPRLVQRIAAWIGLVRQMWPYVALAMAASRWSRGSPAEQPDTAADTAATQASTPMSKHGQK